MQLSRRPLVYLKQIKMMLQDVLIYRADFVSRYVGWIIRFAFLIFLWSAIAGANNGEIGAYQTRELLTYFLIMQMVTGLIFGWVSFHIANAIEKGDLATKLILPVHPILLMVSADTGRNIFFLFSNVMIYVIIGLAFPSLFDLNIISDQLPLAFLSLIFAYLINTSMMVILGLLAFWIVSAKRLMFIFFAFIQLFSGTLIPIDLYPAAFQTVLFKTPFPYLVYYPIRFFQGEVPQEDLLTIFGVYALYAFGLLLAVQIIYTRGLRKFEGVGR